MQPLSTPQHGRSKPRLLVVGISDPASIRSWSGTSFYSSRALGDYFEIVTIGPLEGRQPWSYDWLRRWNLLLRSGWFVAGFEPVILQQYAEEIQRAIQHYNPDAILAIHADPVAQLTTTLPVFFLHDATFAGLVDYYPEFSGLCPRSVRAGHRMQAAASGRCAGAIFSSDWAADSARADYQMPPERVHMIPFGANLSSEPEADEVERLIAQRASQAKCELLFVGVDWARKGGETLIAVARGLIDRGVAVEAHVVGCDAPAAVARLDFIRSHGFLSKADPVQSAALQELWRRASYLVVPSTAECYGCVYCEANAFGIPAVGRDTGGVSTIIREGRNGFLIGPDEAPQSVVDRLAENWQDKSRYAALARQARREFEERLNWRVFAQKASDIIFAELGRRKSVPAAGGRGA